MAKSKARQIADLYNGLYGTDNVLSVERENYTSSNTDQQTILSINSSTSNTFVFHVKSYSGTDSQLSSINVIVEGSAAYLTEYGEVRTGSSLSTYDVSVSGANVELQATPSNAVTDYTVVRINL
jgi:hypothetical protein